VSGSQINQVPSSRAQYINRDGTPTRVLYYFLDALGVLANNTQSTVSTLQTTVSTLQTTVATVGQVLTSSIPGGSSGTITNNTPADITSISLPAGSWNVYGSVFLTVTSAPISNWRGWISSASASIPTPPGSGAFFNLNTATTVFSGANQGLSAGMTNITSDGTVTAFLSCSVNFGSGSVGAYGFLGATQIHT
jgi:hypothetical protein